MSAPPDDRDGWRIVATDHNTRKLSPIVQILSAAGHCVFAAYNGPSALELVLRLPDIDLLVTNSRIGIMDGPELMRQVQQARPELPILHVINYGEPDGGTAPAVPTLREPFTPNQLLLAVASLLTRPSRGSGPS
jgi:CheY-like chemotaxis protein